MPTPAHSRAPRILVADDDAGSRVLLRAILTAQGHDVVEAADGVTALERVADGGIDLVLLDVMMPRMDGFEVCRRIRGDLGLLQLPVVFLTGQDDRDARIRAIDAGADDLLCKPADDLEVVLRVRSLLRLVALDQFKLEMSSLVVHDLKNVMLIIGGNLEHAIDIGDGAGELHDTLGDAQEAAARAIRLIANLMDVARLESSALAIASDPIDPRRLFVAATKHRTSQVRGKRIELAIDVEPDVRIVGDFELLQRVVDNILDNAVRYTPAGGRIVLRATRGGDGGVRLAVGNTGSAIAADDRERIFGKYGQGTFGAPGHRVGSGTMNTGLGLYFCQLATAAHDGRIRVDSEPDLPTVFVIDLPPPMAGADAPTIRRRLISMRLAG